MYHPHLSQETKEHVLLKNSTASNPLTAVLPETPGLSPAQRATERFAVKGNAIVTGGAGGLGFAACRALLEHGLSGLSIFDIGPALQTSQPAIQNLREEFPSAKIEQEEVDVRIEKNVHDAVQSAVQKLGSVDILLCFAGIARGGPATDTPLTQWQDVLDVNTTGSWLCAQAVGRQMIQQGTGGSIVFTSSVAGYRALYPIPQVAYGVSKAGVHQMKTCLAAEWASRGIRVNSVSPGFMDTVMASGEAAAPARQVWEERTPMGRMGDPSELAGALILFCSPAGRFITGVDILVTGGSHVY